MSLTQTRFGGNDPSLPGAIPPGVLSRRTAMVGVAGTVFGLAVGTTLPASAANGLGRVAAAQSTASVPASPDAHLVAHAERLVALAHRCDAAAERQATLEDRLAELCPGPEPIPQPSGFSMAIAEPGPAERVFTVTKTPGYDLAHAEWQRATVEAEAAHAAEIEVTAERLGLPEVERRSDRMMRRRDRWAADLAAMRPVTMEGLAAKASVFSALLGQDYFSRGDALLRHGKLLDGLLADVVRLSAGGRA